MVNLALAAPRWNLPIMTEVGMGLTTIEFHDQSGALVATAEQGGASIIGGVQFQGGSVGTQITVPQLAPGMYTVECRVSRVASVGAHAPGQQPIDPNPLRTSARVRIVGADEAIVSTISDAETEERVRSSITVDRLKVASGGSPRYISASVSASRLPIAVAYHAYLVMDGDDAQRISLSTFTFQANAAPNVLQMSSISGTIPDSFNARSVDIILVPDLAAAESSPIMSQIAGVPLTYKSVPVVYSTPPAPVDSP